MTAIKKEDLINEIDTLPIELKTEIVERILSSINPTEKSIDDLWLKEANKRIEDIESGKVTPINGEEVFEKLKKKFD